MPSNRRPSRPPFWVRALERFMQGVFRLWSRLGGRRSAQAGFVFPTTLLLVLMVLLTASALTYRSFNRSTQVIGQREQQVIYNAATPAIDRAKAKLEFLFQEDTRFPGAPPTSDFMVNMLMPKNARVTGTAGENLDALSGVNDPYTLPDETRIDINNDGKVDNAWSFKSDVDGNGTIDNDEIVAYSILIDHAKGDVTLDDPANDAKADALVTRSGPLATTQAIGSCPTAAVIEEGWQQVDNGASSSVIQKNFQITAVVGNNKAINQAVQSLEFQQSRIAQKANKWGAWFRYDLDIFPGETFVWNGAMHTEGSLIIDSKITSYMLTSNTSCLYSTESSEITIREVLDENGTSTFQGQVISGQTESNSLDGNNVTFHYFDGNENPAKTTTVGKDTDSVGGTGAKLSDILINPIKLYLTDETEHINKAGGWTRDAGWKNRDVVTKGRIRNDSRDTRPYVDDFFRADNRWGPRARYDARDDRLSLDKGTSATTDDNSVGDSILDGDANSDTLKNSKEGLDGYWERQAAYSGLRLIVGERLQLGNPNGWNYNPPMGKVVANVDPLYPPISRKTDLTTNTELADGDHLYRQHRALRDNLAAVQGMVVYHYDYAGEFPAACVALTAHHGTSRAIVDSRTFSTYSGGASNGLVKTDFFNGQGTNGWEFAFPTTFDDATEFATQVESSTNALGAALRNLARFAGDPKGGAPSFPPEQDAFIHPYPYLSMWGDYSGLRRIFDYLDNTTGASYAQLSIADKSTLHSAACTLTLLAYNVHSLYASVVSGTAVPDPTVTNLPDVTTALVAAMSNIIQYVTDAATDNNIVGTTKTSTYLGNTSKFNPAKTRTWNCDDDNDPSTAPVSTTGFNATCDTGKYFKTYTWNDWKQILLDTKPAGITNAQMTAAVNNIEKYGKQMGAVFFEEGFYSILRDRELGFRQGQLSEKTVRPSTVTVVGNEVAWSPGTSETGSVTFATGVSGKANLQCDPNYFGEPVSQGTGAIDNAKTTAFAIAACAAYFNNGTPRPATDEPKFPALYYIFPMVNHDHDGTGTHAQPAGEEYITGMNAYAYGTGPTKVNPTDDDTTPTFYRMVGANKWDGMSAIAAVPGKIDFTTDWELPTSATTATLTRTYDHDDMLSSLNANPFTIQVVNGGTTTGRNVTFLDKVIMNGREQMAVRVLDIDIKSLTANTTSVGNSDYWLPSRDDSPASTTDFATKGIVYAFREDAVREDEIVRPKASSAAGCDAVDAAATLPQQFKIETTAACQMLVRPGSAMQDPPLQAGKVSMKAVDFAPDPDRRPYGFRFRTRDNTPADFSGGTPATGRKNGMTFVTDDSVYIQGDFNVHTKDGTTAAGSFLEEYTHTLQDKALDADYFKNFYGEERTAAKLNLRTPTTTTGDFFADFTTDHWRPVEILADGITVLSSNFEDGSALEGFRNKTSSFTNWNRPVKNDEDHWLRELGRTRRRTALPTAEANPTWLQLWRHSPVWVDRNGTFFYNSDNDPGTDEADTALTWDEYYDALTADGDLITIEEGKPKGDAKKTYINAVFVGSIVPERVNQTYGGLHNYPRFLESWDNDDLFISGAFIQLNFSNAATAPYDQDAWEPGDVTLPGNGGEYIEYYKPPNRRWGFDVGLLYVPAAPASSRFNEVGRARSEYYRELPADDPYVKNLRCAKSGTNFIFSDTIRQGAACPA